MRVVFVVGLMGCGGVSGDDSASACSESTGSVYGTVLEDWTEGAPTPAPDARLQIAGADQEPIEVIADDAGEYTIDLTPGEWQISATSADGYCMTHDAVVVTLSACQASEADVSLTDCVLTGR